jgi:hypothetical protein
MWFVPPDLGARVLVIFAEGGQGFWIGCIQDEYANMAVPAPDTATTFNEEDRSRKLPIGEYNKKKGVANGDDPTKFFKPANDDQINVLEIQGLLEDETRGLTSSSARREIPSAVFGISTPGPYDRRPGSPQTKYGLIDDSETTKIYHNRLGGSSLIFDDGDASKLREKPAAEAEPVYVDREAGGSGGDVTIPHNEMLRLKTRTGHQILMHNSEDLIYITNAKGTAWIELTANGKIDVYAEDSVSIHSKQDVNVKADRDINFEAGRDFNVKANRNIALESIENTQLLVGKDNKITTKGQVDIHTGSNNFITAGANTEIKSSGDHIEETGGVVHMNGPAAATATPAEPLQIFKLPDNEEVIMKRVPQHEPWQHHENLFPTRYSSDITDRLNSAPVEDSVLVKTSDTFRKGGN